MVRIVTHSLPTDFLKMMQAQLGDAYPAFLCSLDEPPALALRLNPKRRGAEEAAAAFIDAPVPWAPCGRYLKRDDSIRPGSSAAHAAGAFYLQEASAMSSAAVLDAKPGERVLDLCAAPGGKSTQIAAALSDLGLLISNDPEPSRARALAGNLERMGAANAVVVSALPQRLAELWPGYFDAVLADAPCSGEGMFRRDPASRNEWSPASVEGCAKRQAEILDWASELLRPGGRLVYSTCTFNATEDEGSVRDFLSRHPDFAPEDFSLPGVGASREGMLRLWPHRVRGDGHFVAKLRKNGASRPEKKISAPPSKRDRAAYAALEGLEREVCAPPDFLRGARLFLMGDKLYSQPWETPSLDGARVISPGLRLAWIGRNHIEPDHALAMALPPELAHRRTELDEAQTQAWLRGEAVPTRGAKGWTLVLRDGLPLGWGKVSEGMLKNHLPKGLRRF